MHSEQLRIEVMAELVFGLPLTTPQIETLIKLAAAHYDEKCRKAGEVGGFIYGWLNTAKSWEMLPCDDPRVQASWRNLDTCVKIMEGAHFACRADIITAEEYKQVLVLRTWFSEAMDAATGLYKAWRKDIEL